VIGTGGIVSTLVALGMFFLTKRHNKKVLKQSQTVIEHYEKIMKQSQTVIEGTARTESVYKCLFNKKLTAPVLLKGSTEKPQTFRDDLKNEIKKALMCDKPQAIIAYGQGGHGKSTIIQRALYEIQTGQ